jgi:hypothetical protein
MIFDAKSQKLPHIGSGRISVTVSDRASGLKLKLPIFDDFDEKSPKLLHIGGGRTSVTASDRLRTKIKMGYF